jgi:hypothetical protein
MADEGDARLSAGLAIKNVSRSKVCGQRAFFPVAALSPVALAAYFSLGLLPQKVIARWPHDGLGINLGFRRRAFQAPAFTHSQRRQRGNVCRRRCSPAPTR